MSKRVTFVNTNQVKPAIAPIAFDYLSGPVARAGFSLTLLDLCFADDWDGGDCGARRRRKLPITGR